MAMPRAAWKGHLKLALISCPVRLYKATGQAEKLTAHYLHRDTRHRIQMIPHDPTLGRVDRADLVSAYRAADRYVVLTERDLAEIEAPSDKTLLVESFVAETDIDPLYLDQPYFLLPDGNVSLEIFDVLRAAMAARQKLALARIVMNKRERMVVIGRRGQGFVMTTLRAAEEVRDPDDFFAGLPSGDPSIEVQNLAEQLIAMRAGRFDPHVFKDRYHAALKDLIEQKLLYGETMDNQAEAPVIEVANDDNLPPPLNVADAFRQSVDRQRKPPATSRSKSKAPKTARRKTPLRMSEKSST